MVRHSGGKTLQLEVRGLDELAAALEYYSKRRDGNVRQQLCARAVRKPAWVDEQGGGNLAAALADRYSVQKLSLLHDPPPRTVSPMAQATVARALRPPCCLAAPTTRSQTPSHAHLRLAGGAPWLAADRRRRRRCGHRAAAGLFGGLFGGSGSSDSGSEEELEPLETDEGGLMVALDASSSGSLDGSSEEPFGPLVRGGSVGGRERRHIWVVGLPGPSCHSIVHTTHLFDCAISLRPELRAALPPRTSRRSRAIQALPARPALRRRCWQWALRRTSLSGCGCCCTRRWRRRWSR